MDDKTDDDVSTQQFANLMLVFLVRGLFCQFQFPYTQFPCTALAGDQMYDPFWECVSRLEFCGFKILALTCDGLAANRQLFCLHSPSTSMVHKVPNPYAVIYFFVDHPHLLKQLAMAGLAGREDFG